MDRKQKILVGLFVTLVIALIYRMTNPFEQETVDRLTYARATKVTAEKTRAANHNRDSVMVDILDSPPRKNITTRRDLFRPPTTPKLPVDSNEASRRPPAPTPPKSEREKIQEHFRRFKAFGAYRHGEKRYLFLQRGKQVLVVTKGDRIDGKFEVIEIADLSATISARNLPEPLKIDFDEL